MDARKHRHQAFALSLVFVLATAIALSSQCAEGAAAIGLVVVQRRRRIDDGL